MEISPNLVHKLSPSARVATIPGLAPGTTHSVSVTAVYEDGTKAKSDDFLFTTLGKYSLQLIKR